MATRKLRTSGFARALLLSAGFLALESTVAFGTPSRLGNRALVFEENVGQTDPRVKFTARGPGYGLFLTSREMVLSLHRETRVSKSGPPAHDEKASRPEVLRMELVGGNPAPRISADRRLPETSNYFLGNDPTRWRTGVATSSRVRYAQVYDGVDLVYYGNQRQLEYDFIVAPGFNPNRIRLAFRGAQRLELTSEGDLLLHTRGGTVRQKSPLIYQQIDGARRLVAGGYRLKGKDRVGFDVGPYERSRPLVIDPVLSYSSYLAGTGEDWGTAIAVNSSGNAYVAGRTTSTIGFPTEAPFQSMFGGGRQDVFVTKFNATGTRVYSTYLGGSGNDEIDGGLVVGADGSAYLAGTTDSADFPVQGAPLPGTLCPECHFTNISRGFLTRLNPSGSALIFSKDLGRRIRRLSDLALDGGGNMYVTGQADEAGLATPGAFQTESRYGSAFVIKINPEASAIVYSTYLDGSDGEWGRAIAVDGSGNAYVTGGTLSTDFPLLNPIFEQDSIVGGDFFTGFVSKLNPSGTALVFSTILAGRTGPEEFFSEHEGMGIAVDALGQAYVTGYAYSSSIFPALLGDCAGGQQFAMKLAAAGDSMLYSTCIPGSYGFTPGGGISLDSAGNAYLAGVVDLLDDGQVAVNKINATGTQLAYSTTLGGADYDEGTAIAIDLSGNAYVTGGTAHLSACCVEPSDAFVFKLSAEDSATAAAGGSVTVSTAPGMSGDAGVTAQLTNDANGSPNVVLESFPSDPGTAGIIDVGGKYVDLKVTGADLADTVTANFYYPTTITGSNETNLQLFYFTGSFWAVVRSSGSVDPVKNTIDNLDGTISGGRFAVLFDATSTPKVTELTGTVFTSSVAVSYGVCLLYDPTKAHKKGSTVPIKIQLCDGVRNLSASDVGVTALGVVLLSTSAPGTLEDSGNANPDSNFRYDSSFGESGGYIYNLSTRGLQTGTYALRLRGGADQVIHTAEFQVR